MLEFISADGWKLSSVGANDKDIIFTNERYGTFNITRALPWAERNVRPVTVEIYRENVAQLLKNIDIDEKRIRELNDGRKFEPVLAVEVDDNGPLIIDGHHRLYIAVIMRNNPVMVVRIIPRRVVDQFRVKYIATKNGEQRPVNHRELLAMTIGRYTDAEGRRRA